MVMCMQESIKILMFVKDCIFAFCHANQKSQHTGLYFLGSTYLRIECVFYSVLEWLYATAAYTKRDSRR